MLDKRLPNYVGVTGVQEASQVKALAEAAYRYEIGAQFSHALMVGALLDGISCMGRGSAGHVEGKTFRHVADWEVLMAILATAVERGVVGMLHCELPKVLPGKRGDTAALRSLLQDLAREGLSPPVQLNGVLLPEEIKALFGETNVPLVLQLRKEVTALGEYEVLRYVEAVEPSIAMILMDPSAGTGERIDIEQALQWQRKIEAEFPRSFTFGYAGGLGGGTPAEIEYTREVVRSLTEALNGGDFSIDVESRVRVSGKIPGVDQLDLNLCDVYFGAVSAGLRRSGQ